MNAAAGNELQRQNQFNQKGKGIFEQSLAQSTPQQATEQQTQGAQAALQQYAKVNAVPGGQASYGAGDPTKNAINEVGAKGKLSATGQATAPMQGVSDWQMHQYIKDLQAKTALNQNAVFARQSESVLPLELAQARNKDSALSGIGGLAQTAGGLMSLYGILNPALAGASAAPFAPGMNAGTSAFASQAPFMQSAMLPPNLLNSSISTLPPF